MISSTSLQWPMRTEEGESKVETMSAPRARAKRSMPSKSACSIDEMLFSAKNASGLL
jgi:hypothetical protein